MSKFTPMSQFQAQFYAKKMVTVFAENRVSKSRITKFDPAPRYAAYGVELSRSTDFDTALKLGEKIAMKLKVRTCRVERDRGVMSYQVALPESQWQRIYTDHLDVESHIGLGLNGKEVDFNFDQPHSLVVGTTGSGKTETVNTILYSLASTHTPDKLKFLMIDPHQELVKFDNLSHLLSPIAHKEDDIKSVLAYMTKVFIHRKENNIRDDYRLVLVVDETNSIFMDRTYDTRILELIATESRKFGINLLICASDTRKNALGNLPRSLSNKFVGYVPNARESAYVTGYPAMQAHYLTGQGDFLHISPKGSERFQVALAKSDKVENLSRGEIKLAEKIEQPDLNYDLILNEKGRPREVQIVPQALVWYLATRNTITQDKATSLFSRLLDKLFDQPRQFGRNWHDLHKDVAGEMIIEMDKSNLKLVRGKS